MGKKFFSGIRVWGLCQNNAMSLSKHLATHIDMILLLFANICQKWLILKNRKLKKINKNNKKIAKKCSLQIKLS